MEDDTRIKKKLIETKKTCKSCKSAFCESGTEKPKHLFGENSKSRMEGIKLSRRWFVIVMAAPRPRLEMKSIFIDGEKKSLVRFGIVKRLRYSILDKYHSFLFLDLIL